MPLRLLVVSALLGLVGSSLFSYSLPALQQCDYRTAADGIYDGASLLQVNRAASPERGSDRSLTLFCFAWSPRRKDDEGTLQEVRRQYNKCDGHVFFTDTESPAGQGEDDFVGVPVPRQELNRSHEKWLYHRNMVGLMPAWSHLLSSGMAEKYDWLINSELDHFLSPSRAKENILEYLRVMEEGSEDSSGVEGPIMLMWGNAFVFNRKYVQVLKANWANLGRVADAVEEGGRAVGCPMFMKGLMEWPDHCSQDMIYPALAEHVLPPLQQKVAFSGASGCGQLAKNRHGQAFPLGCWEMQQNPINGQHEEGELTALQELAAIGRLQDSEAAGAYCRRSPIEAVQKNCLKFWDGRNVPVIHHLHTAREHFLARTLLDNDPGP